MNEPEVYVIYDPMANLWWSNDTGWGDWFSATRFMESEKQAFANIPMGGFWKLASLRPWHHEGVSEKVVACLEAYLAYRRTLVRLEHEVSEACGVEQHDIASLDEGIEQLATGMVYPSDVQRHLTRPACNVLDPVMGSMVNQEEKAV
jgi:hypothetical protein